MQIAVPLCKCIEKHRSKCDSLFHNTDTPYTVHTGGHNIQYHQSYSVFGQSANDMLLEAPLRANTMYSRKFAFCLASTRARSMPNARPRLCTSAPTLSCTPRPQAKLPSPPHTQCLSHLPLPMQLDPSLGPASTQFRRLRASPHDPTHPHAEPLHTFARTSCLPYLRPLISVHTANCIHNIHACTCPPSNTTLLASCPLAPCRGTPIPSPSRLHNKRATSKRLSQRTNPQSSSESSS
jgi:hypothetical protein